jgi:hypothetical protein
LQKIYLIRKILQAIDVVELIKFIKIKEEVCNNREKLFRVKVGG